MKRIYIDVSEFRTTDTFYRALLSELGAPDWHGHNLDALWDSITGGDINEITPPYHVEVSGSQRVPTELSTLLNRVKSLFEEAKADRGIDVSFKTD
ncbi:MAG: barstar family protein [Roseovarius sp.]